MMRKVSYLVLGAAIGAATIAWGPSTASLLGGGARAAAAATYRQLTLFGDVFA